MWNLDAERLQGELRRQGMTHETLAQTAQLEPWQLRVVLDSKTGVMDPAVIARLAAALGAEIADIASEGALVATDAAAPGPPELLGFDLAGAGEGSSLG